MRVSPAGAATQRLVDSSWRLRVHLGPHARRAVRRSVDAVLAPSLGSICGAGVRRPLVALTIDDGPDPRWTDAVLDVLALRGVHATFFVLVDRAERHPRLVRRAAREGHEIGLHGIDHEPLTDAGPGLDQLLREGRERLEDVCGQQIRWLRPPFGSQSLASFRAATRAGLDVVMWGSHGSDWEVAEPAVVALRVAASATKGDIVLLHDGLCPSPPPDDPLHRLDRAEVMDRTVAALDAKGLAVTSVGDLLANGRPRRSVWFRPAPS
jgi:peptidoglycan/xylan/chitin deacetylase (PgdA/CDA1 family)